MIVFFEDSEWHLLIQTCPSVACDSMCETSLFWKGNIVYISELGYSSSSFRKHIDDLLIELEGKSISNFSYDF